MRLHVMMAVAAGLLIAADAPKDQSAKSDLNRLQGTWTLISAVRDGKPMAEDEAKRTTIVFTGDRFRFPRETADATSQRGTFRIDPTKRPRQMDATSPEGEVALGIYEVEGDDYRVCFAPPARCGPPPSVPSPAADTSTRSGGVRSHDDLVATGVRPAPPEP